MLRVYPTRRTPLAPDAIREAMAAFADDVVEVEGGLMALLPDEEILSLDLWFDALDEGELPGAAAEAVTAALAAGIPVVEVSAYGLPELERDVAVAMARLLCGAVFDLLGTLGTPERLWPPGEAAVRPVLTRPERRSSRDDPHESLILLPTRAAGPPSWRDVVGGMTSEVRVSGIKPGDDPHPDAWLTGGAWFVLDDARVMVEVQSRVAVSSELRELDAPTVRTIRRALGAGAPVLEIIWWGDRARALALLVAAVAMEQWGSMPVPWRSRTPLEPVPTTPGAARARAAELAPDLPREPGPWGSADERWAEVGGVDFDAPPPVVPDPDDPWEDPEEAREFPSSGSLVVLPTRPGSVTCGDLRRALGDVWIGGGLQDGESDDDRVPFLVFVERGEAAAMVTIPFYISGHPHLVEFVDLSDGARERVLAAIEGGGATAEILAIAEDPACRTLALEVAVAVADRVAGVIAADRHLLLERAGVAHGADELRALLGQGWA